MKKTPKSNRIHVPAKMPKEVPVSFEKRFINEGPSIVMKKEAISLPVQSRIRMFMKWSTEKKDLADRWTWGSRDWTKPVWKTIIRPFLCEYEKKRWFEIEREKSDGDQRHKNYLVGQICEEAQRRLIDIDLDDLDEVFRFRLGSRPRLYGFLI